MNKVKDMTTGHPLKLLVEFSYPLVVGHVLQQLHSIADSAVVGRLIGYDAFAAIGAAALPYWLVLSFVLGITQGFGITFSHRFGAGNKASLRKAIAMAIVLSSIIGVALTAGALWLSRPLLVLLNTPSDIFEDTARYLAVVLTGIGITITYNLLAGILRALGNSKAPVRAMVISSVVNIALDVVLISVFNMGITAVALTTILAQLLACVYCFGVLSGIDSIVPRGSDWRVDRETLRSLLAHGTPLALRNAVTGIGGLAIQYVINSYGTLFIAGVTAAKKFLGVMEIMGAALEAAVATYVGQNYRARKFERIREGMSYAARISLVSAVVIALVMVVFGKPLVLLLVSGKSAEIHHVLHTGYEHLVVIGIGLPALYFLFIWRAALQGLGNTFIPMLSGFVELGLRVVAIFSLPAIMGELGIAFAECAGWIGAAILVGVVYAKARSQKAAHVQTEA